MVLPSDSNLHVRLVIHRTLIKGKRSAVFKVPIYISSKHLTCPEGHLRSNQVTEPKHGIVCPIVGKILLWFASSENMTKSGSGDRLRV